MEATPATRTAPGTPRAREPAPQPFAPGTIVDDYVIGEVIGEGGMGVVLAARDPDLDRPVAIKVLRRDLFGGGGLAAARARLLREAQAMAKLSHPNVITVYRVGAVDDQIFIAMELVEGGTLRRWLAAGPSRAAILEMFLAAGRGLAAAHACGLVHRDFKPDNVLVGADGRPRVTDFGLAAGDAAGDAGGVWNGPLDHVCVTQTGAVLGTPVYMAPEQHDGAPTDARADQFAFCVALFEALTGARPFAGDTYTELVASVRDERIQPRALDALPRRLRQVLARGMRRDPAARFRSMDELLAALAPASRRRWWIAGGVAAAALATAGIALGIAARDDVPCGGARARWRGVWDDARKQELRAAFIATGRSTAAVTHARAVALLDAWTERWVAIHEDSCRATHVRGEQSAQMLDRKTVCLDRRRDEAERLIAALIERSDAVSIDGAVRAVAQLTPVDGCADGSRLELLAPLPADPAARERIAALARDVEDARTAERLGELERGLSIATRVLPAVDATGYAPLAAANLLVLGKLQQRATVTEGAAQSLRRAVEVAARAGDAAVEAEALSQLLSQSGDTVQDQARVEDLTLAARSAVARAGSDAQLARLEVVLATIEQGQGRYPAARTHYEQALAIWRDKLARDPTQYHLGAAAHLNFGALLADLGDNAGARAAYERARKIWSDALGEEHPYSADVELNLGVLDAVLGDHRTSRAHHERALAIYEHAYGPDHERVATALSNFGDASIQLGEPDRAFPAMERALAIRRKLYGDQHLAVATSRCTIGVAEARHGRGGIPQLEQCLAIRTASLPAGHHDIAQAHGYVGLAHEIAKQPEVALREYALAARLHAAAGQRQEEAQQENNLGLLYGRRGDRANAIVHLRRADAAWQASNKAHPWAIETRFALAKQLWDAGDRRAARELATAARDAAPPAQRPAIAAWLAEHAR